MSAPPTPIINLDFPNKNIFEINQKQWNKYSTEPAKNGTLQEWITEPLHLLTSESSSSAMSNGQDASLSSLATGDENNTILTIPEAIRSDQMLSTVNGQHYLEVPLPSTSNGLNQQAPMPVTSNGCQQMYSVPATTSNGHCHQIPMPGTSNGSSYGVSSYGVHYTGSNGNVGYSPNMSGVHTVRPANYIIHPFRPNGGCNVPNGGNGYFVRPGWPVNAISKVVNGVVKKQKRNRTAFTSHQMAELEQEYARARYLDRTRRIELASTLNLNQRTVKIWFQNRRMKEKKDRLEVEAANMGDLPIFVQDGQQYVQVGIENGHFNPALCAEMPMPSVSMPSMTMPSVSMPSVTMPSVPMPSVSMPSMPMPPMPMPHMLPHAPTLPGLEMPYVPENAIQVNGVQAQQPPVPTPAGAGTENPAGANNVEDNWDLAWIRSINIGDDLELQ
ncbi:uncharacterized protein LOC135076699 [Ostrinia nubilalis]|uniref:uncharacterized protein LOC135076699 n=1 Tax=Ostrinia nubilalis TaxID=29057 RepID=UPI0030824D79